MTKLGNRILKLFVVVIPFSAAFFCLSYSCAADEGASSAVKELMDKGSKAINAGNYDEAISYADQAIQIDSNHAEAYNLRGVARYNKNDKDLSKKAIEDFDRAITLKPDFPVAYTNRGNAKVDLGLYDSDINDQNMALRLSPNYAKAYAGRGVAYHWKEEYDRAIADFSRALELDPDDFSSYRNRGNTYFRKNEYALAIKDFARAIQMRPDKAELYWYRARCYLKTGNLDEALADANQSLEKNPKAAMARFVRAEIYLGKRDFERAIKDYTESLELKLSEKYVDAAYFGRANAYHAKGLVNDALNDFRKAAELQPDNKEYAGKLKELEESPNHSAGPNAETIERKPPKPTPKPALSRPAYQTSTLITQPLKPSSRDQTVKYEERVAVIVPGGGLKEQDTLTISSVSDAPVWNYLRRGDIAIYDITFKQQHTFDKPLTFEFAYDSSQLGAETAPEQVLGVAYLESNGKTWTDVPVRVDRQRQKVIVSTSHNGLWRFFSRYGSSSFMKGIFEVRYWRDDFQSSSWTPNEQALLESLKSKRTAGTLTANEKKRLQNMLDRKVEKFQAGTASNPLANFQGCLGDSSFYSTNAAHPKYVVDTASYLERARITYADKFGKELKAPAPSVAEEVGAGPGHILAIIDPGDQSSSNNAWLGYIGVHQNTGCESLGVTLAHELFHAVQSLDYNVLVRQPGPIIPAIVDTLNPNIRGLISESLWWFESTADYAAFKIVMGFDQPSEHSLGPAYFSEDFFSNGNPDENHPYKNAYFFDYLVNKRGFLFNDLYNKVAGSFGTKAALDDYIKKHNRAKIGLHGMYHDWVKYVLFDGSGPYKSPLQFTNRRLDTTMQRFTIQSANGLTAGYKGIYPSVDAGTGKRTLTVEMRQIGLLPEYCWVDVFKLNQNERSISNLEVVGTWDMKPVMNPMSNTVWPPFACRVDLDADDALYVVVTKSGSGESSLDINVSDVPSLVISPRDASISAEATQSFTATVSGSENKGVKWSVREGAAGGTISSAGGYTAPAVAGTYHVVATSLADPNTSVVAAVTVGIAPPKSNPPCTFCNHDSDTSEMWLRLYDGTSAENDTSLSNAYWSSNFLTMASNSCHPTEEIAPGRYRVLVWYDIFPRGGPKGEYTTEIEVRAGVGNVFFFDTKGIVSQEHIDEHNRKK